jgi:hypothetical protein
MYSRNIRAALIIIPGIIALALWGCSSKDEELPDVPTGVNLVKNPSFEQWIADVPRDWKLELLGEEGKSRVYYGKSAEEKNTGDFSFYMRGVYDTDQWYVLLQRVPIIPDHMITFSGAMSSQNLKQNEGQERRANIFVRFLDRNGDRIDDRGYADTNTQNMRGTAHWSIDTRTVRAPRNAYYVDIGVVNSLTGFLYFDDISLVIEEPAPWLTKDSKYITYYYFEERPLPEDALEKETALIEDYAERLGIKVKEKLKYFYYPSEEVLHKYLGVRKGHQRALWERKELHTTEPYEDHIVVHLLLSHLGYPPYGLGEGVVFALIGNWFGDDLHLRTKANLMQLKVPPLYKALTIEEINELEGAVVIPAWGSFCTYLIDKYGMEKFIELYRRSDGIEDSSIFNVHFKDLYGEDFPVVDRAWRLYVLRYEGAAGGAGQGEQ